MEIKEVNCRIGSLEIYRVQLFQCHVVNCRIGSLETKGDQRANKGMG